MTVISKTLLHSTLSTTANIYSHLTWDVALAAVHTIEARARWGDLLATATPPPNPLFSHAA